MRPATLTRILSSLRLLALLASAAVGCADIQHARRHRQPTRATPNQPTRRPRSSLSSGTAKPALVHRHTQRAITDRYPADADLVTRSAAPIPWTGN
jgi:hypothetical protein